MNEQEKEKNRLLWLASGIFCLFALLIVKFYMIQMMEYEKWSKVAARQHFFVIKEPFRRGTFFSNTSIKRGHPETPQRLVSDIEKFHLYVDPESLPDQSKKVIVARLISMLDLTVEERLRFKKQFYIKSRSRKLALWLEKETKDQILNWWHPYAHQNKIPKNALYFVTDYQRSYPFGKLLGQVLHTIQHQKDEKTHQAIPTGGLELYFNRILSGKLGKRRLMRSPLNSLEMGEVIAEPEQGADIYLTINHYLQAIAEEELAKGVKKNKAKGGWAVMMEPRTGEILALAQYPFFYPPDYAAYFNDKTLIEHTKVKAVTDANEPGSVMKPITVAIGLMANEELRKKGEAALFSPEEKMATSNSHFTGRSKPLKDTHFHAFLNMDMAIQKSSNIYCARVLEKILKRFGNDWYRSALCEKFGFGYKTGLELFGESPGLVPKPGKKHPNGTLEWSVSTPYSLAMGHNIQTNAIQLCRAYSIFANGGYLVSPTLVRKIVKTDASGIQEVLVDHTLPERAQQFPQVMSKSLVDRSVQAMKYNTKKGGTSRRADVWGYSDAGKSGTAIKVVGGHYSEKQYCSSFIGFTPAKNPAFVLVVTMDEPEYGYVPGLGLNHHGGTCSAPVFREIARRSLEYLGITPDDPYGYPTGDPRADPEKADWGKEVKQLGELYDKWNSQAH